MANIEFNNSQNGGLEDYNIIFEKIFPYFITSYVMISLGQKEFADYFKFECCFKTICTVLVSSRGKILKILMGKNSQEERFSRGKILKRNDSQDPQEERASRASKGKNLKSKDPQATFEAGSS